jgi:aryl-alcohol dehydrogenase-like predicted oxidoreductase
LRWVLDQPFISSVIVGIKDEIQVDQSVGAAGWQMDAADRQELSRLSAARQRLLKGLE